MKRLLPFLLLLVAAPLQAQTAVDTVWVTVEGPLFVTTITTVERRLQLGDTVQFVAIAQDQEGDSVTAVFTWASSDPAAVSIDPLTGIAIALQKTTQPVGISVLTEQVSELLLATFRDGNLNFSGNDTIFIQKDSLGNVTTPLEERRLQYCAYLINASRQLVAQDPGPPTCPLVFQDIPLQADAMFARVPRIRPLFQVRDDPG